jgi:predicted MFS family arabinose efflux permease
MYTVLWLSETISLVGDRILMVALIAMVYRRTESAASLGLLSMLKAIPALVLASIAGVFVDRWPRKWTMVISNLIQGSLVLLIPVTGSLPAIFGIYLGMSVVSQFFVPARSASIPDLVPPEKLVAANSSFAIGLVGAIVVGPALGGWISDRYGPDMAFYVDSLTFFVPAVAVACLPIPQARRAPASSSFSGEWREGLALVRDSPDIQGALILIGVAMMQAAGLSVLGIVLLDRRFGASASGLGSVMSTMGAGMLAGAAAQGGLRRLMSGKRLAAAGAIAAGFGMAALPWMPSLPLCMACSFILGLGFISVQANAQAILQGAPERLRCRALGLGQAVAGSVTFLAAALLGILAKRIPIQVAVLACGMAPVLAGIGILMS